MTVLVANANGKIGSAVVDALVAAGANVNQAKKDGATPLMVSTHQGHLDVVQALVAGGAMIFTFIDAGASAVISFDMRSAMPAYIVVPPESTTLAYRSLRMSTSHFMIES